GPGNGAWSGSWLRSDDGGRDRRATTPAIGPCAARGAVGALREVRNRQPGRRQVLLELRRAGPGSPGGHDRMPELPCSGPGGREVLPELRNSCGTGDRVPAMPRTCGPRREVLCRVRPEVLNREISEE